MKGSEWQWQTLKLIIDSATITTVKRFIVQATDKIFAGKAGAYLSCTLNGSLLQRCASSLSNTRPVANVIKLFST
jgi:hypothetical protein